MTNTAMDKLIELYTLYEFELKEKKRDYMVFQHNTGYFHNIEIVLLSGNYDITNVKKQYEEVGFSISTKQYTNFEEMHEILFNGFFKIDYMKKKVNNIYKQFCELQTSKRIIKEPYQYIECNYTLNNGPSSEELTSFITKKCESNESNLIIIEAAAGFGKTCSSYQILHKIAEKCDRKIPILAELSKNRTASIFKYVLFSEIDANFRGLGYPLVETEIKNGRVILIIDGFDELLSKSFEKQKEDNNEQIKNAQTMLDTISCFLTGDSRSKVILTSRKSSIFTGEIFDNWLQKRELSCSIDRIQLGAPNPVKWIGEEKAECLKQHMPEFFSMANPILLDTIRNIPVAELPQKTNDDIIDCYFNNLLSREQKRQSLIMTEAEQIDTMQKLAAQFVELNISSEEPGMLSEIFELILENGLDDYVKEYENRISLYDEKVPGKEEFLSKLVHHAFLDRATVNKNNIGFINEFTFGWLIGEAVIQNILNVEKLNYKYLDIASTAFSLRSEDKRKALYDSVELLLLNFEDSQRLYLESKLLCHAANKYSGATLNSLTFNEQFIFNPASRFENCIFYDCTFDKCSISPNAFLGCQFVNCIFYDVRFIDESDIDNQLIFISCKGQEVFSNKASEYNANIEEGKNYKRIVLEQFWKIGKEKADPRCGVLTVYKGLSKNDIKYIDSALNELINSGLIKKLSVCYELNFSRIDEIKAILGR